MSIFVLDEHGRPVQRYFTTEEELNAIRPPDAKQRALELAGAWKDVTPDDMEEELDRLRHSAPPSKPLDL